MGTIKATELRIGNIVNKNYSVNEIHLDGCILVDANSPDDLASEIFVFFENIKPMPLTKKWLFKFGFIIEKELISNGFGFNGAISYSQGE